MCLEPGVGVMEQSRFVLWISVSSCLETADAKKNNNLISGNAQVGGEQEKEGKEEEDKEGEGKTNSNRYQILKKTTIKTWWNQEIYTLCELPSTPRQNSDVFKPRQYSVVMHGLIFIRAIITILAVIIFVVNKSNDKSQKSRIKETEEAQEEQEEL